MKYDWPGNVRQLENICHWLTVMAPAQVVEPKDLPPEVLLGPAMAGAGVHEGDSAPAVAALPPEIPPQPGGASSAGPGSAALASEPTALAGMVVDAVEAPTSLRTGVTAWEHGLEVEAQALLEGGRHDVWDEIVNRVESRLILTALSHTRGRRIEAAHKLGIGRNTITRKIQELGLERDAPV
mgnify:CR=1 FL=1